MWITKDGYVQERIVDPQTGITRKLSVKIKGTGKKAEQEAIKKLEERVLHISDKRIKLSEAIDIYIKDIERSLKPSSVRKASLELKSTLRIVGDAYMENITAGYIRKKFIESGRENRTLNGFMKIFKTFWMWCYRNDIVQSREVFDKLVPFQDSTRRERIQDKYLETREMNALLDGMSEGKWKLLTKFLLLSGMRIGEVIALDQKDVWGTVIRIYKTYDANNKIITEPKTLSSRRDIFVQDELQEVINEIRAYMAKQAEVFEYETDIFFPDEKGHRMHYESYSKYLRETSERVLGRRITPHTLRHTHCSMLAAKGMNLEAISARLGHDDSRITKEIYLHRMEELKEKENKQLNSIHLIG